MACKWLVKSWRSGRIILKMELSIDSTHWSMVEVDHLWKISDHVCFTVAVTGALHFHHRCCFLFNYSFIHVLFASVVVATVSNTSLPPHKPNENKWPMFQLKPERLVPNPKFHFSYLKWPKLPGSITVPLFRPHSTGPLWNPCEIPTTGIETPFFVSVFVGFAPLDSLESIALKFNSLSISHVDAIRELDRLDTSNKNKNDNNNANKQKDVGLTESHRYTTTTFSNDFIMISRIRRHLAMNSFTSAPFATTIFEEFTSLLFDRNKKRKTSSMLTTSNYRCRQQQAKK